MLATICFLGSIMMYPAGTVDRVAGGRVILAAGLAGLSMLAKEPGITALGICAAADLASLIWPVSSAKLQRSSAISRSAAAWQVLLRLLLAGTVGVAMLAARLSLNQGAPRFTRWMNPIHRHPSAVTRILRCAAVQQLLGS